MRARHALFAVFFTLTMALGVQSAHADPVQMKVLVDDELIILDSAGNVITDVLFGGANEGINNPTLILSLTMTHPSFATAAPAALSTTFYLAEFTKEGVLVRSDAIELRVTRIGLETFNFRLLAASDADEDIPIDELTDNFLPETNAPRGQAVTGFVFANFGNTAHPDWFVFVRSDTDEAEVPEPASLVLFSIGVLGMAVRKRVRRR